MDGWGGTVRKLLIEYLSWLFGVIACCAVQRIEEEETFKNFEFVFYDPNWAALFSGQDLPLHAYCVTCVLCVDYEGPLTDLIEPSDGFHPSQTGNALFAQKFFKWMEEVHPEVLGPVNPYNAEIDAMFFK